MQTKSTKTVFYKYSIAFIILCTILIAFVSFIIYLYSDDVYYATFLSNGFDNFIKMNIEHYYTVNGRLLVHVIDQTILFISKSVFIVINPLLLLGFSFFASKCFSINNSLNKENIFTISAFILFFIMCLPKEIINESVYWITGAMNYTLPALFLVIMYYYLKQNILNKKNTVIMLILCFLTGATTEQGGFLAFFLSAMLVLCYNTDKWRAYHFAPLFSMAGLLSIILAPGTLLRISYSRAEGFSLESIFYMLSENISALSVYITGAGGINTILIMLIFTISFLTYSHNKINRLFLCGPLIVAFMLYQRIFNIYTINLCIISSALSILYLTLWILSVLKHNLYRDAAIFITGSLALQVFMLASPVLGTRTLLVSALLLSAAVGFLGINLINSHFYIVLSVCLIAVSLLPLNIALVISAISTLLFFKKEWIKLQGPVLILILLLFFMPIANGYWANYKILKNNEKNIPTAQETGQLYWNIDLTEPYRHKLFYENADFEPFFLMNNGLPADTQIYLVSKIHKPIYFENKRLKAPSIVHGERYFPLRDIFEAADAVVTWDSTTMSINVDFSDIRFIFKDDYIVTKIQNDNAETLRLDNKKQTLLCRTYLPESFVAGIFDIKEENESIMVEFKN